MGQQASTFQPASTRNYQFQTNSLKIEHESILKLRSTPFPNCVEIQTNNETLFLQDAQMSLSDLLNNRFYTNRLFLIDDIEKMIEGVTYTLAYLEQHNIVYKDLNTQNIYYSGGAFKVLPNELIELTTYERAQLYLEGRRTLQNQEEVNFPFLSPELIIALRYKENKIDDFQLLQKSNVFILGLILLQATTLMPSKQCYDQTNYDIFNTIISERLQIIEDHYNQKIARIIANMLDYDYSERMNPKTLSIWVNRQLTVEKEELHSVFSSEKSKAMRSNASKSTLKKSIMKSNVSEKQFQMSKPVKIHSRTNLVYINGSNANDYQNDENKQFAYQYEGGPKNKIYLDERFEAKDPFLDQHKNKFENLTTQNYFQQNQSSRTNIRERQRQKEIQVDRMQKRERQNQQRQKQEERQRGQIERQRKREHREQREREREQRQGYQKAQKENPIRKQYQIERFDRKAYLENSQPQQFYEPKQQKNEIPNQNNLNRVYDDSLEDLGLHTGGHRGQTYQKQRQNIYQQKTASQKSKFSKNPYYQPPERKEQSQPLKIKSMNKYFPDLEDLEKGKQTETKRLVKHSQVNSKQSINKDSFDEKSFDSRPDESINRIKIEIEKSRKLIQEFRRSEGLSQN